MQIEVTNPRCLRCGTVEGVRDRLGGKTPGQNLLLCDPCDKFFDANLIELSIALAEHDGVRMPRWFHGLICSAASAAAHVNAIFRAMPAILRLAKLLLKLPVLHLSRWMMLRGVDMLLWCAPKDKSGLQTMVASLELVLKAIKEFTDETA